jgi:predicted site-specific integrase-resolvase
LEQRRIGDDLLVGAKAIANWLGVSQRTAFYWAEKGLIPAFKIGKQWAARKSALEKRLAKFEDGEAA